MQDHQRHEQDAGVDVVVRRQLPLVVLDSAGHALGVDRVQRHEAGRGDTKQGADEGEVHFALCAQVETQAHHNQAPHDFARRLLAQDELTEHDVEHDGERPCDVVEGHFDVFQAEVVEAVGAQHRRRQAHPTPAPHHHKPHASGLVESGAQRRRKNEHVRDHAHKHGTQLHDLQPCGDVILHRRELGQERPGRRLLTEFAQDVADANGDNTLIPSHKQRGRNGGTGRAHQALVHEHHGDGDGEVAGHHHGDQGSL